MGNENKIHKAIELAAVFHKSQLRKGTNIPYIAHPFEVAQMLTAAKCRSEVIIAGLLHDTVEDTDLTLEAISMEFGEEVERFVKNCSEDKSKSWKERKLHTVNFLSNCNDMEMLILSCADKTSNLRSIKEDYEKTGNDVWKRFKASKEQINWYYGKLNAIFEVLSEYDIYWENTKLYQELFDISDI